MDIRANQLRKLSFKIHSISGMFLGLYILLMALAGSILVFYNEWSGFLLPSVESPAMHQNKAVTIQDLIANTEAAYSGYRVTWIKLKGYGSDFSKPILVYARSTSDSGSELGPDRKGILLNPVTGKVMGPAAPFIEAVRFFHFDLFRADFGRKLHGFGATAFLLISSTGLIFLLLKSNKFPKQLNLQSIHTIGGVLILPMILIWSSSAIYFAFPTPVKDSLNTLFGEHPVVEVERLDANSFNLVDLDRFVRSINSRKQERAKWLKVTYDPKTFSRQYSLLCRSMDDSGSGITYTFDFKSGNAIREIQYGGNSNTNFVITWLKHLHFGDFYGVPVKVLWTMLGLVPAFLFCSGLCISLKRRRGTRA